MVCFHTPTCKTRNSTMLEYENSSKKRRWREESQPSENIEMPFKDNNKKPPFDTKRFDTKRPRLETRLPLEWQRCLDIKSGQLYFYNTKTRKRTTTDPRISPEPTSPPCMSLDLQLNLPYGSVSKKHDDNRNSSKISDGVFIDLHGENYKSSLKRYPSWLTIEGDQREMVTAVCKRCHMLVIMCKSYPTCPNCKFVHPQN